MEMNTRLQVEHPVTEMITGLDLVEWQLRVAAGERCRSRRKSSASTATPSRRGSTRRIPSAISCPQTGRIEQLGFLRQATRCGRQRRHRGDAISPFYDPMIAKIIVWGADRGAAVRDWPKPSGRRSWPALRPTLPSSRLVRHEKFVTSTTRHGVHRPT